jgi:hypothetical protein
MTITNDILDELIGNAKSQDDLFGKDGVIKELSKQLMERMLQGEMTLHTNIVQCNLSAAGVVFYIRLIIHMVTSYLILYLFVLQLDTENLGDYSHDNKISCY